MGGSSDDVDGTDCAGSGVCVEVGDGVWVVRVIDDEAVSADGGAESDVASPEVSSPEGAEGGVGVVEVVEFCWGCSGVALSTLGGLAAAGW